MRQGQERTGVPLPRLRALHLPRRARPGGGHVPPAGDDPAQDADTTGRQITGLLNPQTVATKDTGMDISGKPLPDDPDNVDLEGLVRLSDGTFWIAEEMGPSLAHVASDGRILKRLVPANAAADYKGAEAEIVPSLPAILSKRQGNRGFESLAISPDERFLYVIMQNPLANPDAAAFNAARNARLFKLERETGRLVGEWIYQLDDPKSFALDPSERQSDPRISEMVALDLDRLLVLERTEGRPSCTRSCWAGRPTSWLPLGRLGDRTHAGAAERPRASGHQARRQDAAFRHRARRAQCARKIEGVTFLGDGSMVLINDNDFGIRGDATQILIVRGAVTPARAVYAK